MMQPLPLGSGGQNPQCIGAGPLGPHLVCHLGSQEDARELGGAESGLNESSFILRHEGGSRLGGSVEGEGEGRGIMLTGPMDWFQEGLKKAGETVGGHSKSTCDRFIFVAEINK